MLSFVYRLWSSLIIGFFMFLYWFFLDGDNIFIILLIAINKENFTNTLILNKYSYN